MLRALPLSVCLFKINRFMYSPIVSRFKSICKMTKCKSKPGLDHSSIMTFVLLELFELSSCAFSQSGNYFARVVPVMMLLTSVSDKQRTNISTDRSGMAPK